MYRIIILSACNCTYNDGKSEINKLSQVYVISMDLFLNEISVVLAMTQTSGK